MKNPNSNLMSTEIVQIPSNENGNVGIVSTRICTAQGCTTDFGVASASDANGNDTKAILDAAREDSLSRTQGASARIYDIAPLPQTPTNQALEGSKAKQYTHSNTKPASQKQLSLLASLVGGEAKLGEITQQTFNKKLEALSSKDANSLIQNYTSNQSVFG